MAWCRSNGPHGNKLCSVISDSERYRGGNGSALTLDSATKRPALDTPQATMLGMAATAISTTTFGTNARKRGDGWEANWFVAQAVVEILLLVIMGDRNTQAAFKAERDADGLYQGGFGTGVTDMPDWGNYNGYYPVIPTSVGLEMGDGTGIVSYSLPASESAENQETPYKTFNVPVFFGLVHAGYGHLWRWVRGLIMDAGEEKSEVYVAQSMAAAFDPNTVAGLKKLPNVRRLRATSSARVLRDCAPCLLRSAEVQLPIMPTTFGLTPRPQKAFVSARWR